MPLKVELTATFSRQTALYLAHCADLAYSRSPRNTTSHPLSFDSIVPFRSKLVRTRGYLALCDSHAVLAFRGSNPTTLPNWLTDAVVRLTACDHYPGRVHHGFHSALHRSWRTIESLLPLVGDRPLLLTGHSMGGALAILTACRLASVGARPLATYTFGSPRVGDPAFCSAYRLPTY